MITRLRIQAKSITEGSFWRRGLNLFLEKQKEKKKLSYSIDLCLFLFLFCLFNLLYDYRVQDFSKVYHRRKFSEGTKSIHRERNKKKTFFYSIFIQASSDLYCRYIGSLKPSRRPSKAPPPGQRDTYVLNVVEVDLTTLTK